MDVHVLHRVHFSLLQLRLIQYIVQNELIDYRNELKSMDNLQNNVASTVTVRLNLSEILAKVGHT